MELKISSRKHGDKIMLIDDEDFLKLKSKPYLSLSCNYFYCYVSLNNKNKAVHRLVLDCPDNMVVDHINHNTLDNRKENLRICTHQENMKNSIKNNKELTSEYKGVSWCNRHKRFRAQISLNGKTKHLGDFKNEIDAAKKYNEAALKYHGKFAILNEV